MDQKFEKMDQNFTLNQRENAVISGFWGDVRTRRTFSVALI